VKRTGRGRSASATCSRRRPTCSARSRPCRGSRCAAAAATACSWGSLHGSSLLMWFPAQQRMDMWLPAEQRSAYVIPCTATACSWGSLHGSGLLLGNPARQRPAYVVPCTEAACFWGTLHSSSLLLGCAAWQRSARAAPTHWQRLAAVPRGRASRPCLAAVPRGRASRPCLAALRPRSSASLVREYRIALLGALAEADLCPTLGLPGSDQVLHDGAVALVVVNKDEVKCLDSSVLLHSRLTQHRQAVVCAVQELVLPGQLEGLAAELAEAQRTLELSKAQRGQSAGGGGRGEQRRAWPGARILPARVGMPCTVPCRAAQVWR
jgi:hypothetical protein